MITGFLSRSFIPDLRRARHYAAVTTAIPRQNDNEAATVPAAVPHHIGRITAMKSYELIIERKQPPCGGKQPKLYDFLNVETDDPVAYVLEHEPELPGTEGLVIDRSRSGVVSISFTSGLQPVMYEFTET